MINRSTNCRAFVARLHATAPPQSCPTTMALSLPKWRITRDHVSHEQPHVAVLAVFGFVAQVVPALIDGHHLELIGGLHFARHEYQKSGSRES